MMTFKEFLEKRDAKLYNEITWQGIKSAGKKAIGTAALLAGLGAGSSAYAPLDRPVDFKFSPDRETLVQTDKSYKTPHSPETKYQVDSDTEITDSSSKDKKDKYDYKSAIRVGSTSDKDDVSTVHQNTSMKTTFGDLTSILPKDIKAQMKSQGLTDNILNSQEKEILNKNVNSLTNKDKEVLVNLVKKINMYSRVTSPKGLAYLTHGHFGYEGKESPDTRIGSNSPDDIYKLNKLK